MDDIIEARPEWKDLLDRIRQGERLTLTEGGTPVATIMPMPAPTPQRPTSDDIATMVEQMRAVRARNTLGDVSWKELRDEGRR